MSEEDTTSNEVKERKNGRPNGKPKSPGKRPRRRLAVKRYDRIGMGAYGELALAGMYRRGGVTWSQLVQELGISEDAARNTLRSLGANKLARKVAINPHWESSGRKPGRPREMWILQGEGIAYGGALNGIDTPRRARRDYGRFNLPGHVGHLDLKNRWIFGAARAAASAVMVLPLGECHGESHRSFSSAFADPSPAERANERRAWRKLEPDGTFVLERDGGLGRTRFYLEVETGTDDEGVISKVDRYAGWFHKLSRERGGLLSFSDLGPVLFLFREPRAYRTLQRAVWHAAKDRSDDLARFRAWDDALKSQGADAGDFFLFGPLYTKSAGVPEGTGPLDRVFRPLAVYPEDLGEWDVGLLDAAALLRRSRERAAGREAS